MVINMTHGNMTLPMLLLLLLVAGRLYAQTLSLPYFNGWEDPAENALWTMNSGINGTSAANRWYVSTKEAFSGSHSLLISDLSLSPDTAAVYSNNTVSIVAARTITLPRGTYDLSFAWRAYGEPAADGLYVAWIRDGEDITTSTSRLPTWVMSSLPYSGKLFNSSPSWTVERTTITSQGQPMQLVFLWTNDDAVAAAHSVSIDDIQIAVAGCAAPSGCSSSVDGNTVTLSWSTSAGVTYEVRYHSAYSGVQDTITGITSGAALVSSLPDGSYSFFIRSICPTGDTSVWTPHSVAVINTGACLDYTNFDSPDVTCYLSDEEENPYKYKGDDRYGTNGNSPRHKVNCDIYETDPRTGGELPVIPRGEFVSVRLGNENIGEAEAVEYTLPLDSGSNVILLMKYAVVLEVPDNNHADHELPKFHLEIVDENGNLIEPTCGAIDFYAKLDMLKEGWHLSPVEIREDCPIIYKEWTTIGVNLADYAANGDAVIRIRLATNDCTRPGHFGYAYFTLDCAEGKISGLSCGEYQTEAITAPDGFNYKWYREDDPAKTQISDSITLEISNGDTETYCCDVISKENADCSFTLTASLLPRFPKSEFTTAWSPEECKNYVRFFNRSYIETSEGITGDEVEALEWDFGNGRTSSETNPVLPVSDEGDTLHVSLKASIAGGLCWDVWDSTIVVPAVGEKRDTSYVYICKGEPYVLNGVRYDDSADVEMPPVTSLVTGCDSIHVVRIVAVEGYETDMDTTICFGDTLTIGQSRFFFSGENLTAKMQSSGGCDSIIHVNLTVLPDVTFGVEVQDVVDGPN